VHKGRGGVATAPRVLVLTADYPPSVWSGIGTAVARQARALACGGVGVQVLVTSPVVPSLDGGVSVRPLDPRRFPVDPASFDLVHLHSLSLAELALQVRARTGAPLVYTAHSLLGPELGLQASAAPWRLLQKTLLSTADAVVVLSVSEQILACGLAPGLEGSGRLHVVGNGVADDEADDHVDEVPLVACSEDDHRPFILFAGRFASSKGLDLLEALWGRIAERWDGDLVLAGGHGDAAGDAVVERLCARWPARCRRTGWSSGPALTAHYREAALVVVPSRYEPFGLVALDALALGTPVLASAVGGLTEIVSPTTGGLTLTTRDRDVWAEAALKIVLTPLSPQQRRRAGAVVRSRYDGATLAAHLRDDVYRPLLHPVHPLEHAV